MPRRPEPEGRRNSVCTKLSDSEFRAVEIARGSMDRSEWVRLSVLAAAERQRPPEGHLDRQAGAVAQNLAALDGGCPHRLPPGAWCKTCKTAKPEGGK